MERIEWRKPVVKVTTIEEIAKYIRAMANSGGAACEGCYTPCGGGGTPCDTSGGCSCGMKCNPLALYLSCVDFAFKFWQSVEPERTITY